MHPLAEISFSVSGFKSFKTEFPAVELRPINILIGRNNSGKSSVVDLLEMIVKESWDYSRHARRDSKFQFVLSQKLTLNDVSQVFPPNYQNNSVPGYDMGAYGKKLVGSVIERTFRNKGDFSLRNQITMPNMQAHHAADFSAQLTRAARWPFELLLVRVAAERRVVPEVANRNDLRVTPNGQGVTNIVRAFITQDKLPREVIRDELLRDLNEIYQGDNHFLEILCREDQNNSWEIFLTEEHKGDVRLSQSGSSLQSVFIILAMIHLVPLIDAHRWEGMIFVIEEPENNLHPSLMRRLLDFVARFRAEKKFTLIMTSHSPVGIDWAARREDSQVIHVKQTDGNATVQVAAGYGPGKLILEELDFRASDILQANGVIWLEGPTDRTYLNKWINLYTDDELREGSHYTCMFYGGKLLSHLDALPSDERNKDLISLIAMNRNAAVILDSDRHLGKTGPKPRKPRQHLNDTKKRIISEIKKSGGMAWVTEGREVENYTPVAVLARIVGVAAPPEDIYTQVPALPMLAAYKEDKVQIARAVVDTVTRADIEGHLDLWARLGELVDHIKRWNGMV